MQINRTVPKAGLMWQRLRLPLVALLLLVLAACAQVRLPSDNPLIVSFEASPAAITVGDSSTLSWEVEDADTVEIDGVPVDATGSMDVSPTADTTYTLLATNRRGTSEAEVTIGVRQVTDPPLIASFTADPERIAAGGSSVLSWDVAGADSIRINPAVGTVPEAAGNRTVSPASTTIYELTATNAYDEVHATVTVTVGADGGDGTPVIAGFSAQPEGIELGESSMLSWNVEGATDITISPEIGTVSSEGEHAVSPTSTQVYTLRATNNVGTSTRNATVHVREDPNSVPLIARFTASPGTVEPDGMSTLSWFVIGADTVSIDQGIGTVSTESSISRQLDETTTFTLTASNAAGEVSNSVTVQVVADTDQPPSDPVVAAFLADPAGGNAPFDTNLYWVIKDPGEQIQSVNVAFGDGTNVDEVALEGSAAHTYTSAGVYKAVLTAELLDGDAIIRSTTIAVGADQTPPQNPPAVNEFSVTPTSGTVPLDASFSFEVTGDGTLSCTINFGDGSGAWEADNCATGNAGHRYMTPGVYVASIAVEDDDGNVDSSSVTVTVLPADTGTESLISDFSVAPASGDAPLDVSFTWTLHDSAGSNVDTWLFYGDGAVPFRGTGAGSTDYTYADPGDYRAFLLAVNEAGDYDIQLEHITAIDSTSVPFAAVRTGSTLVELDANERGLLAPLLGGLLGSAADLSVLSNETLLQTNVNLFDLLDTLAVDLGPDGIETILLGSVDLGEIVEALLDIVAGAAAAAPLEELLASLPAGSLPLELGELLDIDLENIGDLSHIDLNVLDLLTLVLQLFNAQNVAGTPEPVELNLTDSLGGGLLDLLGLNSIVTGGLSDGALARIHLQVVEPPAITFARTDQLGEAQAGFRTAGVRLAVELDGLGLSIDTQDETATGLVGGLIGVLGDLLGALNILEIDLGLTLTQLSIFAEVGTYEGYVSDIDLTAPSVTVQSSGALAHLHLGSIDHATFFDRTRTEVPEVDMGNIATLNLDASVGLIVGSLATITGDVAVGARASTNRAVAAESLTITGPFPKTATLGSDHLGTMISDLLADLELDIELDLDIGGALGGLLSLDDLLDPITGIVEDILDSVLGLVEGSDGLGAALPLDDLLEGLLDNLVFRILGINFNENEITVIDVVNPTE